LSKLAFNGHPSGGIVMSLLLGLLDLLGRGFGARSWAAQRGPEVGSGLESCRTRTLSAVLFLIQPFQKALQAFSMLSNQPNNLVHHIIERLFHYFNKAKRKRKISGNRFKTDFAPNGVLARMT